MQIRPRLTPEEYQVILDYRDGLLHYNKPLHNRGTKAKILLFDLETFPISSYVWGIWKQNVNQDFILADWFLASWAAKWLDSDEIYSDVLTKEEVLNENDKRVMQSLWNMIDEADIIIAHNAIKFDVKKMNTRFLFHGFNPPSHYEVVDTLAELRKTFAITSNRLDYVNKWLGLEGKLPTNASLWSACMKGDEEALAKMLEYNENDVLILERNYLKIRGWIKNHPNINLFNDIEEHQCPNCSSTNLTWKGHKTTKVGRYSSYRCNDCGHIGHSRFSNLSVEKRKAIVR